MWSHTLDYSRLLSVPFVSKLYSTCKMSSLLGYWNIRGVRFTTIVYYYSFIAKEALVGLLLL